MAGSRLSPNTRKRVARLMRVRGPDLTTGPGRRLRCSGPQYLSHVGSLRLAPPTLNPASAPGRLWLRLLRLILFIFLGFPRSCELVLGRVDQRSWARRRTGSDPSEQAHRRVLFDGPRLLPDPKPGSMDSEGISVYACRCRSKSGPCFVSRAADGRTMLEPQLTQIEIDIEELWLGQGASVMRLVGEIDMATVDQFRQAFPALSKRHLRDVVIDTTGVTFMDSTGLHALIEGKRIIHEKGTNIVLVASRPVRRVLEIIFPQPLFAARVNTLEEALAVLSESA